MRLRLRLRCASSCCPGPATLPVLPTSQCHTPDSHALNPVASRHAGSGSGPLAQPLSAVLAYFADCPCAVAACLCFQADAPAAATAFLFFVPPLQDFFVQLTAPCTVAGCLVPSYELEDAEFEYSGKGVGASPAASWPRPSGQDPVSPLWLPGVLHDTSSCALLSPSPLPLSGKTGTPCIAALPLLALAGPPCILNMPPCWTTSTAAGGTDRNPASAGPASSLKAGLARPLSLPQAAQTGTRSSPPCP